MSGTEEEQEPARVSIPWWNQTAVGMGDVVARATKAVGLEPCAPCERRRRALNRLVSFGGTRKEPQTES